MNNTLVPDSKSQHCHCFYLEGGRVGIKSGEIVKFNKIFEMFRRNFYSAGTKPIVPSAQREQWILYPAHFILPPHSR